MAEEAQRLCGLSSGLAVVLSEEDSRDASWKSHMVSYCDNFGDQSVEQTLEHIFNLPHKVINQKTHPVDCTTVRSIIKKEFLNYHPHLITSINRTRDGVYALHDNSEHHVVVLDESRICGDIRTLEPNLLVESHALFSSARANTCVWKGKWMYEVTLETCGIQQLGWATAACPFTDHKGVGDADDSYAYDGKRVRKWNKEAEPYGQSWVVGDVIGCCIDLGCDDIMFYRNGISLGVAFSGVRKMVPGLGYYPAISLSQGERCVLNFGGLPFRYPINDFHPIQDPPSSLYLVNSLFDCFSRLLQIPRPERAESDIEKLRRLKHFTSFEELSHPVSRGIIEELFSSVTGETGSTEYIGHGPLLVFMMEIFGMHPPHDYMALDRVLDSFLEFEESKSLFEHLVDALSSCCKTASLILSEYPFSGSYIYLALACHILRRDELMILWWKSSHFDFSFEGFLSRKIPNKQDLQSLIPSVWWPGSCEDVSNEDNMVMTTKALSEDINKIEEKQRDLCRLVMQFVPPTEPLQLPGSVFRTVLQNILLKNRGADHNLPPPGVSNNSVLVSLFSVILHFLSEGFAMGDIYGWIKRSGTYSGGDVGFLHRGGQQSFPASLFLRNDSHRVEFLRFGGSYYHILKCHPVTADQEEEVIQWEEGCMDDEKTRVTHYKMQKPCCCSIYDDLSKNLKNPRRNLTRGYRGSCSSISEKSTHVTSECSYGNLNDEITYKPSTIDHSDSEFTFRPTRTLRIFARESTLSSVTLKEEELLDAMVLLYHLGLKPSFKKVSSFMSRQSQSISLLEETDRRMKESIYGDQVKRLKEARNAYREEVVDCVRHSAWFRLSLFSHWKQRGIYALCMWLVQLLLVLSKLDSIFIYVPEYYLETMVDCFHVLRKSYPPFVPATMLIKQGLSSFVTFVSTHFNDPRISSAELRDLLLQSISALVQHKEFLAAFECNEAATSFMPKALLSSFDNRSWIPVTFILLRLFRGSGFEFSKRGESSSPSLLFQKLMREACISDDELFSVFLNRLFNTLSWTITEFSVSIREMQENFKVINFQQRKCSVIFDLSCNLARILEFCTREMPLTFLSGIDTNMRRLTELIVFIFNQLFGAIDSEVLDLSLRQPGQSSEKVNRGMIFAPLAGIILNLSQANIETGNAGHNDIVSIFVSMDCADIVLYGFECLLDYVGVGSIQGEDYVDTVTKLENFSSLLIYKLNLQAIEERIGGDASETDDSLCCICYTKEADTCFVPCSHVSCYGCISRNLLNCPRCFFCNATVVDVVKQDARPT